MFEKVLIATDLSPASDCLIQCAGELKAMGLKEAVLAHAVYVANTPGLEKMLEAEASPDLERQKGALEEHGVRVTTEMQLGIPAHTLMEMAEKHDASAIVIGSRGRGILSKVVLGSVSFKLLQITSKPVLLSSIKVIGKGENCQFAVCQRIFENILFTTDFSDTAERAFDYLEKIVAENKSSVTLLHVQDRARTERHLSRQGIEEQTGLDRERLERMEERLQNLGGLAEIDLARGIPIEEILQRTNSGTFSMILMGTQGKGFFREALLGSVANEVARHGGLPVLFIPAIR